MRGRRKAFSAVASIVLLALICCSLLFIARTTERVVPDNPITAPTSALTVPRMLVAPDDQQSAEEGQGSGQNLIQSQQQRGQNREGAGGAAAGAAAGAGGAGPNNQAAGDGGGATRSGLYETDLAGTGDAEKPGAYRGDGSTYGFYIKAVQQGHSIANVRYVSMSMSGEDQAQRSLTAGAGGYAIDDIKPGYLYVVTFEVLDAGGSPQSDEGDAHYKLRDGLDDNPHFVFAFRYLDSSTDKTPTIEWNNPPQGATIQGNSFLAQFKVADYRGDRIVNGENGATIDVVVDNGSADTPTSSSEWDESTIATDFDGRDSVDVTVTVKAADAEGHYAEDSRTVTVQHTPTGGETGTISLRLDLEVLGKGFVDVGSPTIHQGDKLSDVVAAALDQYGYSASMEGSYLAGISGGGITDGAQIPEALADQISLDGLSVGPIPWNSLHDQDITRGSGWLYSVNGTTPSRNLGDQPVQDGDQVTLAFTLAWGKDLGQSSSSGGNLSRYCVYMSGGSVVEHHRVSEDSRRQVQIQGVTQDPTCTQPGVIAYSYSCSICGKLASSPGTEADGGYSTREVPALGHDWTQAGTDMSGNIIWRCDRCYKELVLSPDAGEPDPFAEP